MDTLKFFSFIPVPTLSRMWCCLQVSLLAAVLISSWCSPARGETAGGDTLTLERVYDLTITSHERIMYAEKEVAKSKLLPSRANSIMFPHINVNGGYIRHEDSIIFEIDPKLEFLDPIPIETIPREQFIGNLRVDQAIYKGNWYPRRQQADHKIESSIDERSHTIQSVLFQATQVYYEILRTKELIKNSEEILQLTQEEKRVATVRLEEGAETEDAVLSAEIKITTTENNLIEYRNRLKLSKSVLNRYIGIDTSDYDVTHPGDVTSRSENLDELVRIAIENRQDYKKALSEIAIAQSDVTVAKSRFHPSFVASWDYFLVDDPAYYQDEDYWVAALKLSFPILEGGYRIWDLKDKKETLSQAEFLARDLYKTISIEVEDAMLAVQGLADILVNLRRQEELAKKHYDIVFSKFTYGAASSVALTDALRTLAFIQKQLIIADYDHQLALLRLEKALGLFAREMLPEV